MSPDEDEETGVTYLEDGTPVQVIYITEEMTLYDNAEPGEALGNYWRAKMQEIMRQGRHG